MTTDNIIELKSIRALSGMRFIIPEYQRGYKWTPTQVTQLLNDVKEFSLSQKQPGEFYCLQPIVVKRIQDNAVETYEVVDGQQRLTTIFIILHYMEQVVRVLYSDFKLFSINYVTRDSSEEFLNNLGKNKEDCEKFIDFYFMQKDYEVVEEWLAKNTVDKGKFVMAMLSQDERVDNETGFVTDNANNVRFIWYELAENGSDTTAEIFSRINIGKIPLTNSELIKALLMRRDNFSDAEADLKQIQIASEWNQMEQELQGDSFWYFLYSSKNSTVYDNRLEFIFDLMKHRDKDSEFYHTFNEFSKEFTERNGDIASIWLSVKKYYQTLREWYENRELYHYIGFLIEYGDSIDELKNESDSNDKNVFLNVLIKNRIKDKLKGCNLENIEYGDPNARKVLLLFNILTVVEDKKSDMRFPFNKFKVGKWDIEHVCSQTDKPLKSIQEQQAWAEDLIEYFVGSTEKGNVEEYIESLADDNEEKDLLPKLNELRNKTKIDLDAFNELFESVNQIFGEKQIENKNHISNLALLDAETNRSYGNAFFPIKRMEIINNDRNGVFVPIVTKNLFLKYYNRRISNMMYWSDSDADFYFESMQKTLNPYLPENK